MVALREITLMGLIFLESVKAYYDPQKNISCKKKNPQKFTPRLKLEIDRRRHRNGYQVVLLLSPLHHYGHQAQSLTAAKMLL